MGPLGNRGPEDNRTKHPLCEKIASILVCQNINFDGKHNAPAVVTHGRGNCRKGS